MKALLLVAVLFCCSIWLLRDSMTFALMPNDPISGRQKGCYTALELAAGVKSPSIIRQMETLSGLLIPFVALAGAGVMLRGKRKFK